MDAEVLLEVPDQAEKPEEVGIWCHLDQNDVFLGPWPGGVPGKFRGLRGGQDVRQDKSGPGTVKKHLGYFFSRHTFRMQIF